MTLCQLSCHYSLTFTFLEESRSIPDALKTPTDEKQPAVKLYSQLITSNFDELTDRYESIDTSYNAAKP